VSFLKQDMPRFLFFLIFITTTQFAICQKKQPVNLFLTGQTSFIAYDQFIGFSGGGFGAGLQTVFNINHKLKAQIDVSANLFSIIKVAFILPDSTVTGAKQSITTIFGGFVYEPVNRFEAGLSCGLASHDDGTDFGIKPCVAYYLGKKKIIKAHASLTHIFVRNKWYNSNTGVINAGLAIKLF
jgi:hypothetical protein